MSFLSASSESEAEDIDISYSDKKISCRFTGEKEAVQTSKTAALRQERVAVVFSPLKRKVDNEMDSVPGSHRKLMKTHEEQEPVYSSKSIGMMKEAVHTSKIAALRQEREAVVISPLKRKVDNEMDSVPASHRKLMKTREEQEPVYSSKAVGMMSKMGFTGGLGLGKLQQGRVAPVETTQIRGRLGLGAKVPEVLAPANVIWDSSAEVIDAKAILEWMPPFHHAIPSFEDMKSWVVIGRCKKAIDDEIQFCDPDVLKEVLNCKTVFDSLGERDLRDARTRSNPFETIKKVFFQNRAAVKMAEIDAVTEFMFTNFNQKNNDAPNVDDKEPLYFADVCAGPGGFSEYVLFRKKWHSKGFGFTLKGDNDFKMEEFLVGPPECFEPYYGKNGDGNVYDPENINSLKDFICDHTDGRGVHFMMADGGFSVDGQENIQEVLSKRLYLCQFLVALFVVRTGGHFVCKLFDIFTPFSVGLIYLMWMSFEQISIFKPNSSRPANSERYIICKGRKEESTAVANYMAMINSALAKLTNSDKDVTDIVPLHILTQTSEYFDYIYSSNVELGRRQIIGLAKIAAFARDRMLTEPRQADMKKKCLEYWKIEEDVRRRPHKDSPRNTANKLIKLARAEENMLNSQDKLLDKSNLSTTVRSLLDWKAFIVGGCTGKHERTFYLSLGRSEVYRYENGSWTRPFSSEGSCSVELPNDTFIYGEIIFEYRGSGKGQRKRQSLYIYDALYLGGEYIGDKQLVERHSLCLKFVKTVNKPSRNDLIAVRVHKMYDTEHISQLFCNLKRQYMKGGGPNEKLVYMVDETSCILPRGVLFLKGTKDPWMLGFSKSTEKQYFFHTMKKVSEYNTPKDSCLPFSLCMEKRFLWEFPEESRLLSRQSEEVPDKQLSILNVKSFVDSMVVQSGIK